MSGLEPRHLSEEELLRYSDGELPAGEIASAREHLEACWQCRTDLDELHKTVGDCVRFRKTVLVNYLPPPPAPWGDIRRKFDDIDSRLGVRPFWARAGEFLLAPALRPSRWVPVAVALVVAAFVLNRLSQTPRVEAAELLRKAVAAQKSHSPKARKLRVRRGSEQFTRVAGFPLSKADSALALRFEQAHYSWQDPLNAASYLSWHEQLTAKQDEVTSASGPYLVRTSTTDGELVQATLKLRQGDLEPYEGTFEFRDQERIEVSTVTETIPEVATGGPAGVAIPAPAPALEHAASVPERQPAVTPGDELRVIAALHRIGADLGDPVEVRRSGEEIVVGGAGIDPERRTEIARILETMPRVKMQFEEPVSSELRAVPQSQKRAPSGEALRLRDQVETYLGGRPAFERAADRALEISEMLMSHAHAMRRLAERFPEAVEAAMIPEDRRLLNQMLSDHMQSVHQEAMEIGSLLEPALRSAGASFDRSAARRGLDWRQNTEEIFTAARQLERLTAAVMGGASLEEGDANLGSRLLQSIARLREDGR